MSPRKKIILEQAALLFKEKGYNATTMRDLAERVGIEPSSLYNHISSKTELLKEICFSNAERFTGGMKKIRESGESPSFQLRRVIELHIQIATEHNSSVTVFNNEWKHLDSKDLTTFKKMRRDYEKSLVEILKEGVFGGYWYDHNVMVLMQSLLSSLRWVHEFYKKSEMGNPKQLSDEIASIWLKGLDKCGC